MACILCVWAHCRSHWCFPAPWSWCPGCDEAQTSGTNCTPLHSQTIVVLILLQTIMQTRCLLHALPSPNCRPASVAIKPGHRHVPMGWRCNPASASGHQRGVQCSKSSTGGSTADPSWTKGVYEERMRVRDYELDQFNVVNNAVYASYCQHARHEALASLGFDVSSIQSAGILLALSELQLTFKSPLRSRDDFRVLVWVEKVTPVRLTLGQRVELVTARDTTEAGQAPVYTVAAEAIAVVVWLDQRYRPIKIPADARQLFQDLLKARVDRDQAVQAV